MSRLELEKCCNPKEECCIKFGKVRGRQTYFCKRLKRRFVWGGKWNKYSKKWFYIVVEMYENGLSLREISRRTGIPFSTVRRFVKKVTIKTDQG